MKHKITPALKHTMLTILHTFIIVT